MEIGIEILPHPLFHADIAENHLEPAEVSLDAIQGSKEGAAKDLVGTGDVSEGGDEGACQVAGVVLTKRTATHRTRFFSKPSIGDNLLLALLAEDAARGAAGDGEAAGDLVTHRALELLLQIPGNCSCIIIGIFRSVIGFSRSSFSGCLTRKSFFKVVHVCW